MKISLKYEKTKAKRAKTKELEVKKNWNRNRKFAQKNLRAVCVVIFEGLQKIHQIISKEITEVTDIDYQLCFDVAMIVII